MKTFITGHAKDRWAERFPDYDIEAELAQAIPFGGQRHGDSSLLSPCEAVFIVTRDKVVRTVLTREQAMANMHMGTASMHRAQPIITSANVPPDCLDTVKLKQIAEEHAVRFPNYDGRKTRHRELRDLGFDTSNHKYFETYQREYFTAVRELKKTLPL